MMHCSILFLVVISITKVLANKYCSLESNGEPKYFICARNEYCCHFGCCVHLAFQFYQLWYYWLLLIFMFMICSGGSWWYKFCRQNETSTYPSIPPTVERQSRQQATNLEASRRSTRSSSDRNQTDSSSSYYFQRIWKMNGLAPPPNYYTASVVRYHSASELETRRQQQECPYYQLYGPPPSYESVVRMPDNGFGHPTCTLMPPSSASIQMPTSQAAGAGAIAGTAGNQMVAQQSTSFIINGINNGAGSSLVPNSGSNITQNNNSNNNNPMPSTSAQNEFIVVPVHSGINNSVQQQLHKQDQQQQQLDNEIVIRNRPKTTTKTTQKVKADERNGFDLNINAGRSEPSTSRRSSGSAATNTTTTTTTTTIPAQQPSIATTNLPSSGIISQLSLDQLVRGTQV